MSKRPFVIFGIFAVICLVALPVLGARQGGVERRLAGGLRRRPRDQQGLELFQINCGACHTLAAAGTDGVIGPDLDCQFGGDAEEPRHGEGTRRPRATPTIVEWQSAGRMPKGILQGAQAKAVAQFVADNVEYIPGP